MHTFADYILNMNIECKWDVVENENKSEYDDKMFRSHVLLDKYMWVELSWKQTNEIKDGFRLYLMIANNSDVSRWHNTPHYVPFDRVENYTQIIRVNVFGFCFERDRFVFRTQNMCVNTIKHWFISNLSFKFIFSK